MSVASNPLAQRALVRALVPTIEELATEYATRCEPVRGELNRLLALPEVEWLEGLYSAGSILAHLELWEYDEPPEARASFRVLAKYEIRQLLAAGIGCNDRLFREGLQRIQDDPPVAEAAIAVRTETVVFLFARCLKHARDATVGRFREALATVGLEPKWSLKEELLGYGCAFSPVALAAIAHWLDRDGPNFWLVDNRVPPIGEGYALPSVQPPTDESAPAPEDEPIPALEADDLQVPLRTAIAELRANENGTDEQGGEGEAPPVDIPDAPQYVTLDQMAALVNRSKKTLERELNRPNSDMPKPDVEGGGGKPHEWRWDRIRPWLVTTYARELPVRFPTV